MATTSALGRSFPTLRFAVAPLTWPLRTRRRRRTAAVLLATIAAPIVWWSIQLMGLPDVGEPFDVQAFLSSRIPDDRNAYVVYQEAARRFRTPDPTFKWTPLSFHQDPPRPRSAAESRRWIEENREAMELFRRGSERPDAQDLIPPTDPEWSRMIEALWWFHQLAVLEAGRLDQEGDPAGAWQWYLADLRATYHATLRGTSTARLYAGLRHEELRLRIRDWASDRRTTPAMLRRALDDVVACGAFRPSETHTLRSEYLQLRQWLDGPRNPGRNGPHMQLQRFFASRSYRPWPEQMMAMADAWRFWRGEPERSRRLLKLVFANWLAYESLPTDRRPAADPNAFGRHVFYAFGPGAPAPARALPPAALVRWLNTAIDLPEIFDWWQMLGGFGFRGYRLNNLGTRARAGHRELVLTLARELYRRDHGTDPPGDEALVGPYLKELPEADPDDPAAGAPASTPTGQGGSSR
jgi:hypothetical protein